MNNNRFNTDALNKILELKNIHEKHRAVACLATCGLSNKEISNQLFITEATVKARLYRIYELMGLKSRAQLIVWCLPHLSDSYSDVIQNFNEGI